MSGIGRVSGPDLVDNSLPQAADPGKTLEVGGHTKEIPLAQIQRKRKLAGMIWFLAGNGKTSIYREGEGGRDGRTERDRGC